MNAITFKRFADKEYHFSGWANLQRDGARTRPDVASGAVFKACVMKSALGIRSLLELDQRGRSERMRSLLDSSRDIAGGSDTTALRALSSWNMAPLRRAGYAWHGDLTGRGLATTVLGSGRKTRLAVIDGTCLGGHWFSALAFAGGVPHAVDIEPYAGRGHELGASRRLMRRAANRIGFGFSTHILYDGLMACRSDFRLARSLGTHLVVKSSEETLEVIASSKEAWTSLSERDMDRAGVEKASGTDAARMASWSVLAQGGIFWGGLEFPLKLAWVREVGIKGPRAGETSSFWVMTTDESLTASELREIAHHRWTIENNQFKELNELTAGKRKYIKNPKAKEALAMMGLLGLILLKAFRVHLESLKAWSDWKVKKTKNLLAQAILFGIPHETRERSRSP